MDGHPYKNHRENAVGHRRVKTLMRSGGYVKPRANGGKAVVADEEEMGTAACPEPDADDMPVAEGQKRGGRLDKRARGGKVAEKFAMGGGAFHKITPSKRKPHINVNVVNINGRRGRGVGSRPPLAINPGAMPLPGPVPVGGPSIAPPIAPVAAGGLPLKPPGMAKGGRAQMRKGKKAGEGSGSGRLEEFKHMRR